MQYEILDKKVLSSNGKNMLAGKVYLPSGEIKGYFHIVHGMTEYIGRYDKFMRILAENGYIAFGYDHLGHGHTAKDDSELGFIAENNGDDLLARDVKIFADAMKSEYGEHTYYLMGHSMGSFVVRMAVQKYITPDKLIIMGTGGPNPILSVGVMLCDVIKKFRGPRHISPMMEKIAFGAYNDHYKEENDPLSWLTKDVEVRKKYGADKFCTFKFTISAMRDLIAMNRDSNKDKWFEDVAKKMPILLISGGDDVVGDFGKGITLCEKELKENGADVKAILYPGYRHEILNDSSFDMTVKDIFKFIE